jgi:hypothetical protein
MANTFTFRGPVGTDELEGCSMSGVTRSLTRRLVLAATILSLTGLAFVRAPSVSASSVSGPTVYATINGGGTALMTFPSPGAGDKSVSSFGIHATLYADGTATGHVDCVDQHDDVSPGNIFGAVTRWSYTTGLYPGLTLFVTGTEVVFPGVLHAAINFPLTIQSFGGAGVGHWTLGKLANPFCVELLLSGQIDERLN